MPLRVDSEIGRLRRVLLHRPGLEIDRMTPAMMEQLLFDDILDGEEARMEHDTFRELLERLGVEVLDAGSLLAETMERDDAREALLSELEEDLHLPAGLVERLADLPGPELARCLVAGRLADDASGRRRPGAFFDLLPVPNYFFQRDPQTVLGNRVVMTSMATEAREREPYLAKTLFRFHADLAGHAGLFEVHSPPHLQPDLGPAFPFPTLEGGDVLVASREVLLVGISERTNRWGVEVLAEHLRAAETSFRHLLVVELPPRRAYMHLDTVFTFVDRGLCLGFPPVVEPGGPEAARVYRVGLEQDDLTFTLQGSLREALAEVGFPVEIVPCGGRDVLTQQREQWTDGANAFAVAPGVILLYHRNRQTVGELARRGWRVLDEDEALAAGDLADEGPTVITFSGRELARARGGPRCMTMPLERDPL